MGSDGKFRLGSIFVFSQHRAASLALSGFFSGASVRSAQELQLLYENHRTWEGPGNVHVILHDALITPLKALSTIYQSCS